MEPMVPRVVPGAAGCMGLTLRPDAAVPNLSIRFFLMYRARAERAIMGIEPFYEGSRTENRAQPGFGSLLESVRVQGVS